MVKLAESWASIDWIITIQILVPPITAFAATVALFLNWIATRNNTKTRDLDIFYKVFQRMQTLQEEYYGKYTEMKDADKTNWLSVFYNEMECVAFLINTKHLKGDFKDFYSDSFITAYEKIFLINAGSKIIDDESQYQEMKKLYKALTSPEEDIIKKDREMFNQ